MYPCMVIRESESNVFGIGDVIVASCEMEASVMYHGTIVHSQYQNRIGLPVSINIQDSIFAEMDAVSSKYCGELMPFNKVADLPTDVMLGQFIYRGETKSYIVHSCSDSDTMRGLLIKLQSKDGMCRNLIRIPAVELFLNWTYIPNGSETPRPFGMPRKVGM